MDTGDRANNSKRQYWRRHIEAWQTSTISQAHYCRENHLSYHQFQYWKRRLVSTQEVASLVEVPMPVILGGAALSCSPAIRVVVDNGYRVEIQTGFDAETLEQVLRVVAAL